jgi:predicted ATPase
LVALSESACVTILRGWALAEQGQGEVGITQMRQGLVTLRATAREEGRPHYLALPADDLQDARALLDALA